MTLHEGQTIRGNQFNEPMCVVTIYPIGDCTWRVGLLGAQIERFR